MRISGRVVERSGWIMCIAVGQSRGFTFVLMKDGVSIIVSTTRMQESDASMVSKRWTKTYFFKQFGNKDAPAFKLALDIGPTDNE